MAECPTTEDFAKKFGVESLPESVQHLTQMITNRDASTEDFAKLLSRDSELVVRLLRAANPRAECVGDYAITTVEDAIRRTGMSSTLLLAMGDPLMRAVQKTFQTMLAIELKSLPHASVSPFTTTHLLGEVAFAGKVTGFVHLRLPTSAVPVIGERLLGLTPAELQDFAVADDVIGELCNIIVGNFKSNLCDAGLDCKLTSPKIARTADFKLRVVHNGVSERHRFRAKELDFFADLSVNPWSE